MKSIVRSKLVASGVTVLLLASAGNLIAALSLSSLPDMSAVTPFATFGNDYNLSAVTINGNSGISAGGSVNIMAPSTINGDLYLATGASRSGPGIVTGTTYINQSLALAQAQVFSASAAFAGMATDYTLGNVNTSQTFGFVDNVANVVVIRMSSLTLGSGQSISFTGDAGDVFILNITGGLALTGNAVIGSPGQAGHTLINLTGTGNLGTVAHVGNVLNATTLVPFGDTTFHSANGAIYSGTNNTIVLMSDAVVNYEPFVPEPATLLAGALLLVPLAGSAVRILRKR